MSDLPSAHDPEYEYACRQRQRTAIRVLVIGILLCLAGVITYKVLGYEPQGRRVVPVHQDLYGNRLETPVNVSLPSEPGLSGIVWFSSLIVVGIGGVVVLAGVITLARAKRVPAIVTD